MIKIINEVNFDKWEEENNFGDGWIINIPKECIKGATLLSGEEYEEYERDISVLDDNWWLRTPYGYHDVYYVSNTGGIDFYYTKYAGFGIRPVLVIEINPSEIEVGSEFTFDKKTFILLSNKLAICSDVIGYGCFRKNWTSDDANDYNKSDVKKVVDDWFNKAYSEYEG